MLHKIELNKGRPTSAAAIRITWLAAIVAAPTAVAFDPLNGDYTRADPLDVRIASYNHNRNFIEDPTRDAAFDRILTTLDPDIICFQEFTVATSAAELAGRLNVVLPIGGAGWHVHLGLLDGVRTAIASRYPLSLTAVDTVPASSTRGVNMAIVELPNADYAADLYILGVHFKCCGNAGSSEDLRRQASADAIANWLGDARGLVRPSGDQVALPIDTPMIVLGDFNLVGGPQPENTLLTGDIQDEATYGPDVSGDWDDSDITDLAPADPFTGDTFTWQGNGQFPPSNLDRMMFTDSVVTVANSFVLNTDTMTAPALAAAGLLAGDTLPESSTDHLPIVMDLRLGGTPCTSHPECDDGDFCTGVEQCVDQTCRSGDDPCPGRLCDEDADVCVDVALGDPWINELHYDNAGTDTGEFVEIAGPAGACLSDWRVVGYNGSTGLTYGTIDLTGLLPDQQGCMGTLSCDFVPMQNGSPDGLALVDPEGMVVEFLSYEGSFTASNGPASGMTSLDIGVSEPSDTLEGYSLQRAGTGVQGSDFVWLPAAPHTRGLGNTDQTFNGCAAAVPAASGLGMALMTILLLLATARILSRVHHEYRSG